MEQPVYKSLPILLVSAKDEEAATAIISLLINGDTQNAEADKIDGYKLDRIWRITNKYYKANVHIHALLDGEQLEESLADAVEGHLIYLTKEECALAEWSSVLCGRVRAAARAGGVETRVAAVGGRVRWAGGAGAGGAGAGGCEAVRVRPPRPPPPRLLDALHAHLWTGLTLHHTPLAHTEPNKSTLLSTESSDSDDSGGESESDEWSEWVRGPAEEGPEGEGEGPEDVFASLLGALPAVRAQCGGDWAPGGGGDRELRLRRAEAVVAAFARALDLDLDLQPDH